MRSLHTYLIVVDDGGYNVRTGTRQRQADDTCPNKSASWRIRSSETLTMTIKVIAFRGRLIIATEHATIEVRPKNSSVVSWLSFSRNEL